MFCPLTRDGWPLAPDVVVRLGTTSKIIDARTQRTECGERRAESELTDDEFEAITKGTCTAPGWRGRSVL
jgi:hypothetical protein